MTKIILNVLYTVALAGTVALIIHYFFNVDGALSLAFGWIYGSLMCRLNEIENNLKNNDKR